jgi:hypothetical protein
MFAVFSLGALAATISLGAVQFAAASGGSTITACANKSTGAMRLLSKGSCKKTERKVAWNQQGIQGQTGAQGIQGQTGAQGIPGTPGIPGVNSVSTSEGSADGNVYDASGKYIGQLVDVVDGMWYDEYKIALDGVYFHIGSEGGVYGQIYFDGANCTGTPFVFGSLNRQWPRQLSRSEAVLTLAPGSQTVRWYRPNSGSLTLLTPVSVMSDYFSQEEDLSWIDQLDGIGSCTNFSGEPASLHRTVELITPPVDFITNSPLRLTPGN